MGWKGGGGRECLNGGECFSALMVENALVVLWLENFVVSFVVSFVGAGE